MKKLTFLITLGAIVMCVACRHDKRHVVISEGNNFSNLKIEYGGSATFSKDSSSIAAISPNGYVKYKRDSQELIANSDANGAITYEVNGGSSQKRLKGNDRIFLTQAVKDMIKRGHNNDEK